MAKKPGTWILMAKRIQRSDVQTSAVGLGRLGSNPLFSCCWICGLNKQLISLSLRSLLCEMRLSVGLCASQVVLEVQTLPTSAGGVRDVGSIPGSGRSLGWAWQPTPVFFPGESHGQRRLAGYAA